MSERKAVWLVALRRAWEHANASRFEGRLTHPVLALSDRTVELGRWTRGPRTLELSERCIAERPWGEVVAVLEHEMAHQYVDEILGVHDEPPHGPTFTRVCRERGIDARAAGTPEAREEEPRILRRLRKLLALADSPEPGEARTAARQAFRLMLEHNLDAVRSEAPRRFVVRQVGAVKARWPKHEQLLAGLLAERFFVAVTLVPAFDAQRGRPGKALEVSGTPENTQLADYVWEVVLAAADRGWQAHRHATGVQGQAARHRYLEGVVVGYREQLRQEVVSADEHGLVWTGDPALDDFTARRYPHRRRGRRLSMRLGDSHAAGREQGRRLTIRKPLRASSDGPIRRITDGR